MKPCILIPFFDHGEAIRAVLDGVDAVRDGLPGIVVDDGSAPEHTLILAEAAARHPWVQIEKRPHNGGKGAALKTGYRAALERGFSHALQLDADGQHDPGALPAFLEVARRRPEALVLGVPHFEGAPFSRRFGRHISTFWVWVETGSRQIRDPLCGLRCMPLAPTAAVLQRASCGDAMDFDPEIAVRLVWEGVPVESVPTRVVYPDGGISHFRMLRDNLRISWLHTRLVVGMLLRLPGRWAARRGTA
ncbi:MAG: glycosyltransferase family 2 protein [Myxococcales bacterium]|nr:glycosyltransferase family 2 protein [Myxococcales bacterium]